MSSQRGESGEAECEPCNRFRLDLKSNGAGFAQICKCGAAKAAHKPATAKDKGWVSSLYAGALSKSASPYV